MGIKTSIEWCDSTVNAQMGCDGCELWNSKVRTCYAGVLTEKYAGNKGWPEAFDKPVIFPDRIDKACNWPDMAGMDRPDKPWLDGYPRTIFLDDMGDTFTESLSVDWLRPYIDQMESSPHIWQFLTKRPSRMAEFFRAVGKIPKNFWLGTSVTTRATLRRINELKSIEGAEVLFVSAEPILEGIAPFNLEGISWVIVGGESGPNRRPMNLDWARDIRDQCKDMGVAFFMKQVDKVQAIPEDLMIREIPGVRH